MCFDRYKNKVANTSKVVGNLQIGLHVLFVSWKKIFSDKKIICRESAY